MPREPFPNIECRIAIVGMAGLFPGSSDLNDFWSHVASGDDLSSEPPLGRWIIPLDVAYDPRPGAADHVYARRGYFLDEFVPDLAGLEIDPALAAELDPLFQLTLHLGAKAIRSARLDEVDRDRIGVILGNIALPTAAISRLAWEQLGEPVRNALGIANTQCGTHPLNRFVAGLPAILLARVLGLGAASFCLDAACASSLYAIKLAVDALLEGRADAMLAGGLARPDSLYTQMGFSQLRALSPSDKCSPFDAAADGLMVGEGGGIFVLKRLADAVEHGDEILGVIRGIGVSNDREGNLLAPASEGQLRAMRAAYEQAGWRPADVDLIECHATGTPLGDMVEFNSLCELWRNEQVRPQRCVLGSVKSTVGHLLTGAGAAALAKVLLAIRADTLPPTANFRETSASMPLGSSPFRILTRAEPWTRGSRPRRAAISGFGFGGINAHLLIEEWREDATPVRTEFPPMNEPIAVVGMTARFGEWQTLDSFAQAAFTAPAKSGQFIQDVAVPLNRFRIPPRELEEMLPQQALMLLTADEAMRDAGETTDERGALHERLGVLIGLNLDCNTTNFHLRWAAGESARDLRVASDEVDAIKNAVGPPLTANRTMGALASIAASRIARWLRAGGPSFPVFSESTSALHALQVAVGMLRRGELDSALVGAVDLAGDERNLRSLRELKSVDDPFTSLDEIPELEGAGAIVLMRLADAKREGRRVYALVDTVTTNRLKGSDHNGTEDLREECTGCAAGMAALIRCCLALHHTTLPASPALGSRDAAQRQPQFWLVDRAQAGRRAKISRRTISGTELTALLREFASVDVGVRRGSPIRAAESIFLFCARTSDALIGEIDDFLRWLREQSTCDVGTLGSRWEAKRSRDSAYVRAAAVGSNKDEIERRVRDLQQWIRRQPAMPLDDNKVSPAQRDSVFYSPGPLLEAGQLAFVYPGSGNQYDGMGRELGLCFPEVLRRQQAENTTVCSQYAPEQFWRDSGAATTHPRTLLFGQVAYSTLATDILAQFGIRPQRVVGYSLGESASLFALRAWAARDEMFQRIGASSLFSTDLAAPFDAARRAWRLPTNEVVDWITALVSVPAAEIESQLRPDTRAYLLIVNSPAECVIGGQRRDVEELANRVGKPLLEIPGVTLAHCHAASPVAAAYRELHHLPLRAPPGISFYSGARGRTIDLNSDSAADSILEGLLGTIDFPRVVLQAYDDGARYFLEIGPGASCTRMVGAILAGKPHRARSLSKSGTNEVSALLRALAHLHAEGFEVDLSPLSQPEVLPPALEPGPLVHIPVRFPRPKLPQTLRHERSDQTSLVESCVTDESLGGSSETGSLVEALFNSQAQVIEAHAAFLRFSTANQRAGEQVLQFQTKLLAELARGEITPNDKEDGDSPLTLSPEQCREFAAGSAAVALGPEFAQVDLFPTRVRLPDGPLLLVDRILEVHGIPKSMTSGRVVTEHRVHDRRWYLDAGRVPTAIAVEAGQADLFLSGYLGIDFETRGLAMYRLLDAVVTFHRSLPVPGETIRYDIHIDGFFRQGITWLFRFRFEGSVDGVPLLTMTEGCAGFFTPAELAGGKGIVHTELDRRPIPGKRPDDWQPPVPMRRESFSEEQIDALRRGDLTLAFGHEFAKLQLRSPARLPGGMLRLVHRVPVLDPNGGRFGLGLIRGEADIHPDDWFLTCHFVDDQVMPGTLMYECCLHTLRILLMRMGWIGEQGEVACEPVPGVASRLKCRGQVIATTRTVTYEVALKEIGFGPEPFAIADALMYADGKPIVEITNMSLRMSGLSRDRLERIWSGAATGAGAIPDASAPLFNTERILAFAIGKPSAAFGEPYRIFDEERVIARLPGPPYQFLDRIVAIDAEPWKMVAGGEIEAEYDVATDAWYFTANRSSKMPFSVLLEVALQPCGWLAAYVGSALTASEDLSFRNLGGKAKQFVPVDRDSGTLRTWVKLTKVSSSAGMIIQHYDFAVRSAGRDVYAGSTYFGFFSKSALANQVGLREATLLVRPGIAAEVREYPRRAPFPDTMMRMIDRISWHDAAGGPAGLGAIQGTIAVDPDAWFFKAHFHQDPVWPGSLGLESFLQLTGYLARQHWNEAAESGEMPTIALNHAHEWVYRGQVLPADKQVLVQSWATAVSDDIRTMTADGWLTVDGRTIYQMKGFTLQS